MNDISTKRENKRVAATPRESFSGRVLINRQFDDGEAIVGILERRIRSTGAFKDALSDYAHAYARSEKFDSVRAEIILRDLFKEFTGKTMNQYREELVRNEETITDDHRADAYSRACGIGDLMENGVKLSFHRVYEHQAQQLAEEIGVTHACAKRLMREEFASAENADLLAWGKELDEQFYRPQIEAEKADRDRDGQARGPARGAAQRQRPRQQFRSRTGPQ